MSAPSCQRERIGYPIYTPPTEGVIYIPGENFYRQHERRYQDAKPLMIYPPLGNAWIALDYVARSIGWATVSDIKTLAGEINATGFPPAISEQTKVMGIKDSPEQACFPLKAMIGYLEESLVAFDQLQPEHRRSFYPLIVGHESTGTCRERLYSRVQEARLQEFSQRRFGHADFDFYSVKDSRQGVYEFVVFLLKQTGMWEESRIGNNLYKGYEMISLISEGIASFRMAEEFESLVRYSQSLVALDGQKQDPVFYDADRTLQEAKIMLASSELSLQQKKAKIVEFKAGLEQSMKSKEKRAEPKGIIVITGEIFHNEEMGSVSADVGMELIKRGYFYEKHSGIGHYVEKFDLSPENLIQLWVRHMNPFRKDERKELAARGGLIHDAGGHSLDVVALNQKVKELQNRGIKTYDGIIELLPFGCLPEIVTASIMDLSGVKYLRLIFDEQAGRAGIVTRLEAYLDMVWRHQQLIREGFRDSQKVTQSLRS